MTPNANTPAEVVDLDQFENLLTSDVVIKNPLTGAPTTSVITVMGPEHPQRKKLVMDRSRQMRTEFQRTGKPTVSDPVEDYENDTEFMVTATVGWSILFGGNAVPFSKEEARKLYADPKRQWLRSQVRVALEQSERFISDSAKA